jgi:DNA polymerase III delta prime subunit
MQEKRPHLFHSTLISGRDPRQRRDYALELATARLGAPAAKLHGIDFFPLGQEEEQTSLNIEEIRKLQGQLATKPYQTPYKVALILEAQRLTPSAQNCLLKTLEEPPPHSLLILTVDDAENILPTVRSRCRLANLGPTTYEGKTEKGRGIRELLQKNRGQRLLWVEENKKILSRREDVLNLLDSWLATLRQELINPKGWGIGGASSLQALRQILATKKTVATVNVNLRLALEVLLLNLPHVKIAS